MKDICDSRSSSAEGKVLISQEKSLVASRVFDSSEASDYLSEETATHPKDFHDSCFKAPMLPMKFVFLLYFTICSTQCFISRLLIYSILLKVFLTIEYSSFPFEQFVDMLLIF